MNGNKLLIGALVAQSVLIIALWFGPRAQTAQADVPDSGGQLVTVNQTLTATNEKLDKIIDLLQGGKLQVRVAKADDQ